MKLGIQVKRLSIFLTVVLAFVLTVPTTASAAGPTVQTAVVTSYNGKDIILTFDVNLNTGAVLPPRTDFSVNGSVQGAVTVSSVFRSGGGLRVTTGAVILGGQTATLTYAPTTNVPTNSGGEPLAGFSIALSNPGANYVPEWWGFGFNISLPSRISVQYTDSLTCALTPANYSVTVNGSSRTVSSVNSDCTNGVITINLAAPILANDIVRASYIPSSGSIQTIFGTPAAAVTNETVRGVPDSIAPVLNVPSIFIYQLGQGGTITLAANEDVSWSVTTDRTLSFQLASNDSIGEAQLLVSSILPSGSYSVDLAAEDMAGNRTVTNITIVVNASGGSTPVQSPSPSATPTQSATPSPSASPPVEVKPVTYKNCVALNKKHLGGIALNFGVKNKGKGMTYIARVDALIYAANFKLDADKDGIACER